MPSSKKYYKFIVVLLISIIWGCKEKDNIGPNKGPSEVKVDSKFINNGKDLILNWTQSTDPEGDAISYSVVFKDTLAKKIKDTTYIIRNLEFGIEADAYIITYDSKGNSISTKFSIKTESKYVPIAGSNFEKVLINNNSDDIQDGRILREKAINIKTIFLGPNGSSNVKSLSGIEYMTSLMELDCGDVPIISLDVSKNLNLRVLRCYFTKITNLDVSKNTLLERLDCNHIGLKSLDISKNVNLKSVNCSANELETLDVSKNIALTRLNCSINKLKSLDVSNNINLESLACWNNSLNVLDISKNIKLVELYCFQNLINQLDVSKNVNLEHLDCGRNKFISLDLTKNTKLKSLYAVNDLLQYICFKELNNLLASDSRHFLKKCN